MTIHALHCKLEIIVLRHIAPQISQNKSLVLDHLSSSSTNQALLFSPAQPPVVTPTQRAVVEVALPPTTSRGRPVLTALPDSTIFLYSVLAVCALLLLTALSLATVVLLRRARRTRARPSRTGATQVPHHAKDGAVQLGQEPNQHGKSSNGQCGRLSSHCSLFLSPWLEFRVH